MAGVFLSGCVEQEEEMINVAIITPLTGPASEYGINTRDGIDLAVKEINEKGGINGVPLKVYYEDSVCDPSVGISALEKLDFQGQKIILGTVCSSVTLAIGDIIDSKNMVLISSGSSNPDIVKFNNVFRTWPSDSFQAEILGNYFVENYKGKSIAVVYLQNDFGDGFKTKFIQKMDENNIDVLTIESIPEGIQDVRTQVLKLKGLNPDVVFVAAYTKETGNFLKTSRELEFEPIYLISEAIQEPELFEMSGTLSNELIGIRVKETVSNVRKSFLTNFKNEYGREPGLTADTAYDSVYVLKAALEKIEDIKDTSELVKQIYYVEIDGASGKIVFDKYGDPIGKEYEVIKYDFNSKEYIVLN
jgi:branched-chain amino acid transport system substrate-binding protein